MAKVGITTGNSHAAATAWRLARAAVVVAALAFTSAAAPGVRNAHAFFASPSGNAVNDGSREHPWDLATALTNAGGRVQPGDTIWLLGGRYVGDFRSALRGTVERPIVVRQAGDARAILDGRLNAYGAYTVFWGFEITQSDPAHTAQRGIDVRGAGHRFVNLVIHDVGGTGIGFWMEGVDAEVYGCIIYDNGVRSSLDHGIYVINRDGRKSIIDNVIFDNFAYGIHVYGAPTQALRGVTIEGNVAFDNGSISPDRSKANLLVGGKGIAAEDIVIARNVFVHSGRAWSPNVRLGFDPDVLNHDVRMEDNTLVGGDPVLQLLSWRDVSVRRNMFAGPGTLVAMFTPQPAREEWRENTFQSTEGAARWRWNQSSYTLADWTRAIGASAPGSIERRPSASKVIVRPNRYETGRAHVVVLNWAGSTVVRADLSAVLQRGKRYELRSVQDLFGAPLVAGRYDGGPVSIPMRPAPAPVPAGRTTAVPAPTRPFFDVFLLRTVR